MTQTLILLFSIIAATMSVCCIIYQVKYHGRVNRRFDAIERGIAKHHDTTNQYHNAIMSNTTDIKTVVKCLLKSNRNTKSK